MLYSNGLQLTLPTLKAALSGNGMKKKIILDHDRVGRWTAKQLHTSWVPGAVSCIGLLEIDSAGKERLIAGVLFSDYNQASLQMHVAAEPGARWMTKAYLGFCFKYAFNQAKVQKILGFVGSGNVAAQRFDEHIGFTLETKVTAAHPDGDLLIYSMTQAQCRWLDIPVKREDMYGQT